MAFGSNGAAQSTRFVGQRRVEHRNSEEVATGEGDEEFHCRIGKIEIVGLRIS